MPPPLQQAQVVDEEATAKAQAEADAKAAEEGKEAADKVSSGEPMCVACAGAVPGAGCAWGCCWWCKLVMRLQGGGEGAPGAGGRWRAPWHLGMAGPGGEEEAAGCRRAAARRAHSPQLSPFPAWHLCVCAHPQS